jgi:hypothetical protein
MRSLAHLVGWGLVLLTTSTLPAQPPAEPKPEPIHDSKTLSAWVEDLKSGDPAKQLPAAQALAAMGPNARPAVPALIDLAFVQGKLAVSLRAEAAKAVRQVGLPPVPDLIRELEQAQAEQGFQATDERMRTLRALILHGPAAEPAIAVLIRELEGPRPQAIPGEPRAGAATLLDERRWQTASVALARIGPPAVAPVIEAGGRAVKESQTLVVARFVSAMSLMGGKAVPGLTAALKSERPEERRFATTALYRIGPAAAGAVEELRRLELEDPDLQVRESAQRSRQQIEHLLYHARLAALAAGGASGPLPVLALAAELPAEPPLRPGIAPQRFQLPNFKLPADNNRRVRPFGAGHLAKLAIKLIIGAVFATGAVAGWLSRRRARAGRGGTPGASAGKVPANACPKCLGDWDGLRCCHCGYIQPMPSLD